MEPKNKALPKKAIIMGVFITFLVVGLIAAFIVVQGRVDIRKQASEVSCKMKLVKCSWNWDAAIPDGIERVEYEYSISGPCNNTEARPCSGTTTQTSIEFEGYPGGTYTCNVSPKVYSSGSLCPVDPASGTDSCPLDSSTTGDTPVTVVDTPVSSCGCEEDGGNLNCNPEEVDAYKGEDGAGLIILNPIYETGDNACFNCQSLLVKDSSDTIVREVNGCKLKAGEDLRLHQAGSEANKCETYRIEAVGESGETTSPESCATCNHTVCCPACVPPENLTVETLGSDPSKPLGIQTVDSCSFGCDFDIAFSGEKQCGQTGETITLSVPEGTCVNVDDDYVSSSEVCDTDEDGLIEISYTRGGVYDVALKCGNLATSSVDVSLDSGSVQASIPNDLHCTKRISVACGGDTPNTPDDPDIPTDDSSILESPTPTPTPGVCKELDVEIICHNCSSALEQ